MKNTKKAAAIALAAAAMLVMAGCEEQAIIYEGVERGESEVAEIISDKLEVENPGLDINVTITSGLDE